VDAATPEPVIEAVRLLLRDRALARRLGSQGRKAVESFYNWDRVTDDLARIGHELGGSTLVEVPSR
jgi:glycosyltransferase involved in cell wall biosynthesis